MCFLYSLVCWWSTDSQRRVAVVLWYMRCGRATWFGGGKGDGLGVEARDCTSPVDATRLACQKVRGRSRFDQNVN